MSDNTKLFWYMATAICVLIAMAALVAAFGQYNHERGSEAFYWNGVAAGFMILALICLIASK